MCKKTAQFDYVLVYMEDMEAEPSAPIIVPAKYTKLPSSSFCILGEEEMERDVIYQTRGKLSKINVIRNAILELLKDLKAVIEPVTMSYAMSTMTKLLS